jgi:hypothetical protein
MFRPNWIRAGLPLILIGAFLLPTACSDSGPSDPASIAGSELPPLAATGDDVVIVGTDPEDFLPVLKEGWFTVCKVGTDAQFTVDVDDPARVQFLIDSPTTVQDGHCVDVAFAEFDVSGQPSVPAATVTIGEIVPGGYQLDNVFIWSKDRIPNSDPAEFEITSHLETGPIISGPIDAFKTGCVVIFYNSPLCTGEIGDFVWNDSGGTKGIQDPGEVGLAGVRVILKDGAGNVIAETVTDANGFYLFSGLCAGDYEVMVDETTVPAGWMQTPTLVGGDPTIDNNPNPFAVTLPTNDASDRTIDFGYMEPPGGDEGCTPGYYKNLRKHLFAWVQAGYDPNQSVASVFSEAANAPYSALGAASLHDGLSFQGGDSVEEKAEILLRAAIAAVLNASNPNVEYPRSAGAVIADVNAALASQDPSVILGLASDLDYDNNRGCPLGNGS